MPAGRNAAAARNIVTPKMTASTGTTPEATATATHGSGVRNGVLATAGYDTMLAAARDRLTERYDKPFDSIGFNLYRAWKLN